MKYQYIKPRDRYKLIRTLKKESNDTERIFKIRCTDEEFSEIFKWASEGIYDYEIARDENGEPIFLGEDVAIGARCLDKIEEEYWKNKKQFND